MDNFIHINTATYLVGDTHALILRLLNEFKQRGITDSAIIILGDVGLGFVQQEEEEKLAYCDNLLAESNNELYLIRGNHDKPAFWREGGEQLWPQTYRRIHFVRDGQQMMIQGKLYVAYGGAISVDRSTPKPGGGYWPDEEFIPPTKPIEGLHGVLAHAGPFSPGFDSIQDYIDVDDKLKSDLLREQEAVMSSIALLQPAVWYGGHYHMSVTLQIGDTLCRCLNVREIYQLPE